MIPSLRSARAVRRSPALIALGLAALLAGCDVDTYPTSLTYPLRGDPIVTEALTTEPRTTDRPGELARILEIYLDPAEKRKVYDPTGLSGEQRAALEKSLQDVFGTPAAPTVGGIEESLQRALLVDAATLQQGSRAYRQHCLHCHGLTGDGRGPTAAWVNPHPRDYRRGVFKFTSSTTPQGQRRARRTDLLRVLRDGIEDSSMPSFRLLPDQDLEALVSYVTHLSIRGQVEQYVMDKANKEKLDPAAVTAEVKDIVEVFASNWLTTDKNAIVPGPAIPLTEASVKEGMRLFLLKDDPKPGQVSAGCASCHLDFGRAGTYRFDDWGTIVKPADLTRGMYRGGRRPLDMYYRIHSGINGAGMPATSLQRTEKEDPIWHLVNFLQVLPYPDKHQQYGINIDTTIASSKGR